MKITVDTNVLISATFLYGNSNRVIELMEDKKFDLVLSKEIVNEYAKVLGYEEIQQKIKDKNLEMKYTIQKIVSFSILTEPKEKVSIIKEDPNN